MRIVYSFRKLITCRVSFVEAKEEAELEKRERKKNAKSSSIHKVQEPHETLKVSANVCSRNGKIYTNTCRNTSIYYCYEMKEEIRMMTNIKE